MNKGRVLAHQSRGRAYRKKGEAWFGLDIQNVVAEKQACKRLARGVELNVSRPLKVSRNLFFRRIAHSQSISYRIIHPLALLWAACRRV